MFAVLVFFKVVMVVFSVGLLCSFFFEGDFMLYGLYDSLFERRIYAIQQHRRTLIFMVG